MNHGMKRIITLLLAVVTVFLLLPVQEAEAAAMKKGSSGTQVKYLQQNLIGLGYLTGSADGSYGSRTKDAVQDLQNDYGLTVDGNAGEATQTAVRNAVVRLQVELKAAGFDPGSADGHFGSKTRNALKCFQAAHGLKETGVADEATWEVLNSISGGIRAGRSLKRGSSGTQVKYLQMALIGLGYLSGSADGSYGAQTAEAVRKYQKAYGLSADGSAGPATMISIKNTIVTLQSDLTRKGYDCGGCDSVYGGGMKAAVKAYQRDMGISVTGVAGPRTMQKLYGYSLGGTDSLEDEDGVVKTWIDSLYQDGDYRKISYVDGTRGTTTVHKSGCAGVATAMALNALLDTNEYTGQNVMQWFADHRYYWGKGTKQSGIVAYAKSLGLNAKYCDTASSLIAHLKKDRLAIAIIKDLTGEALFTYSGGGGHYILLSGYRERDGVDQVFVNNPLSYKASKWYDIDDLMDNVLTDRFGYENSFVILYD